MTRLVFGHDEAVADWVLQRDTDGVAETGNPWIIGIVNGQGKLRGAFSICVIGPGTVTIGLHSEGATTPQVWRDIFAFVFNYLGASRCEMVTRKTNKVMKKHAPNLLGFRFEGVRRDWYGPGLDGLAFYMTPATCKWIENHELPVQSAQAA